MTTLSDQLPHASSYDATATSGYNSDFSNEQQEENPASKFVNVGKTERQISALAGGALALFGLSRRSIPGLLIAGVGAGLLHRAITGHCYGYEALGVDTNSDAPAKPSDYFCCSTHVEQSFTVNKPAAQLFNFWRSFDNLPKFMQHLEKVEVLDDKRSRWTAKGPAGSTVTWDAEIINEEPDRLIAWRSLAGADVDNAGSVRFIDAGNRGTEVRVVIDYIPPAGKVGSWIAWLFGEEPTIQIKDDLRRFKQLMETGEIATTEGQPRGTCTSCG
jgi:uncharacterized membrane protein